MSGGEEAEYPCLACPPWVEGRGAVPLAPGEVQVWRFTLDPPEEQVEALRALLDEPERARAMRFRTGPLRSRFIVGRGMLRILLGRCLGRSPREVAFRYGPHGKPSLASAADGLRFNLAHSHGLALCALSWERELGVDVEAHRKLEDRVKLIERFFSERERAEFLALPSVEQPSAFFRGWTRKEAFLKAVGSGLAGGLDSFDVTLGPDAPPALLDVRRDPAEAGKWRLFDIPPGPGFSGALAVASPIEEADSLSSAPRLLQCPALGEL